MIKDLRGKIFNNLEVINIHSKTRNGHIRYICRCLCGKECNILGTHLIQGNTKSCGCLSKKGKDRKDWTGFEEISGDFWYNHIVRSAGGDKGRKEIDLTITKEYVWNLFLEQNRKCKLSGLELTFPTKGKDRSYTVSLDRIDSSKGYIEGNVQWINKDINIMKNKYNQEYFIEMCRRIAGNMCEV